MAKNAKTSAMEVDGAIGGANKAISAAEASTSNSGGARAKEYTGKAGTSQRPPGNGGGPNRGGGESQNRGGGGNQNQGGGGKRHRKPKPKLKPGDPGWEEFRQKRNKRRAEQLCLQKKNGKRSPYALYIDASGVTTENAKRIPISLAEWKHLLQDAVAQMALDMIEMEEEGVDSPGDTLYLAHQCFVEHVPKGTPKGTPMSNKPDDQRFGHGAMFFDTPEAEHFASRAFRGTSVVRDGRKFKVVLDPKEVDRRAAYTMVVQKVIWRAIQPYFWRCVRYAYRGLPEGEPEIVKEKATDRSDHLVVIVIRADRVWETCLDSMNERLFKLPFGRFVLRKKSLGIWPKPQAEADVGAEDAEASADDEGEEPETGEEAQ